eukprot:2713222-Pyramimonas_sp.AAC.1
MLTRRHLQSGQHRTLPKYDNSGEWPEINEVARKGSLSFPSSYSDLSFVETRKLPTRDRVESVENSALPTLDESGGSPEIC